MRYRELLERALGAYPTDPDVLETICDDLCRWVSQGDAGDKQFGFMDQHWPKPNAPQLLWRIDVLTAEQMDAFQSDGTVTIPAWPHHSWTKSSDAIERLARERSTESQHVVVTHMVIPAEAVTIDINAFNDYLMKLEQGDSRYDFDNADLYHWGHEQEVIVKSSGSLTLTKETTQIKIFAQNDRAPKVGEMAFLADEHTDDGFRIEDIDGHSGNGYWNVSLSGRGEEQIYFDGDWLIV